MQTGHQWGKGGKVAPCTGNRHRKGEGLRGARKIVEKPWGAKKRRNGKVTDLVTRTRRGVNS